MRYVPTVPPARSPAAALPSATDLMARLCSLVAFGLAHLEHHPAAYENPSGRVLAEQYLAEAKRIFRREPDAPDESTL